MWRWLFFFLILTGMGCSYGNKVQRKEIKDLQKGRLKEDTSYVYALPFEPGRKHRIIQGYFSAMTHRRRAALDFRMKKGTTITAIRDGIVLRLKEDGKGHGMRPLYRKEGNFVVIIHPDGSRAGYWHLQNEGVLVNVGDTVKKGQAIALSGNTGYSFMPHLHLIIWRPENESGWRQIATRFKTQKGNIYLRPYRRYRNPGN